VRAALITVSSSRAAGSGSDQAGPELERVALALGLEIAAREVIADERELIESHLRRCCDELACALVLTSGGTGMAPSDVTPEATSAVVERPAPGIAEALRLASREHTRHWMLSRGVAGVRGRSLIVNFPGSPASIRECAPAIAGSLPHALALLAGGPGDAHL